MQVRGNGKSIIKLLLILLLTVGVICSCCSCAVKTHAKSIFDADFEFFDDSFVQGAFFKNISDCKDVISTVTADENADDNTYIVLKGYSNFLDSTLSSTVVTRYDWLKLLIDKLDIEVENNLDYKYRHFIDKDYYDGSEYFITAIENDILWRGGITFDPYSPVTRQYVCYTYANAVGYDDSFKLKCDDLIDVAYKPQVAAMVHLGYFELDSNDCFNPVDGVEPEQVMWLLDELDILKQLKGKTVMSFGDSIMHGVGKPHVGIADCLSKRYMMTAIDYSVCGATFGSFKGRSQISKQIGKAMKKGEKADIILLNGGTNDMRRVECGAISDDFDYKDHGRKYFAQGMEYAIGLLEDNYPDTPVLYIRAHDMEFSVQRNEIHYGEMALSICDKWDLPLVDMYKDTDFDTDDKELRLKYTEKTGGKKQGDSVHPNRLGYYKYYIPMISDKMLDLLSETE